MNNNSIKGEKNDKICRKKIVVRTSRAGVFFGTLVEVDSATVTLANARKLWYWDGACAVEELAVNGVQSPENCKFTVIVPEMKINNWEQILPATKKATEIIEEVPAWKRG